MMRWCKALLVVATVGTAVHAQTIFRDTFDGYANDAEMTLVWPVWSGATVGTLSTAQSVSAPKSLFHPVGPGNERYHVFADATTALIPTDADPILWKFMFYDDAGAGNTRKSGSLLTSENWNATTDKWIEFGAYGLTSQTAYCIRTVNLSGPNWAVYPGSARSIGWHTMRVEIGATFIKFKLDALAVHQVAVSAANVKFTTLACGGPSNTSSAAGGAYYDDVHVSLLSCENCGPSCSDVPPVSINDILLSGATSVNVYDVNPSATRVTVYKSSTGTAPWTEIGSSTATPFGSTVAITVPGLVAGDTLVATQNMTVIVPGFPATPLESCQLPDPKNVVDGCKQIPAVNVIGLTDAGRSTVLVNGVDPTAQAVTVYRFAAGNPPTLIGSIGTNNAPGGASLVTVNVAPALVETNIIRATQTVQGIEGCVPTTGGRTVTAAGVIENFEGTVTITNHPTTPASGVWYDIGFDSYTDNLMSTMPSGSKCINITDHGWKNGAYVRYDSIIPASGTYHLTVDMLIDEHDPLDPDFYKQYQVGVIVNGAHRDSGAGTIPAISAPIGEYVCLTPQRDGGDPQLVYVATFTAVAGDSLLIAFSSDIENSGHTANKTATPAGYVGMKVDNIRLIDGPKPSQCTDVPPVTIVPTSLTPLEAGGTSVTVAGIDSTATNVKVLADNVVIGSVSPDSATQLDVPIDTDPVEPGVQPLVAGTTLTAKQTVNVNGILTESCQCPGAIGPMVGKGINSGIRVALGIRETGGAGPVGADGGITGNIEWVGSSSVKGADGQPIGKLLATGVDWQEVTFRWEAIGGTDLVAGFTGNGVVDGAWGVLESLNFTLEDSTNTGHYEVYVDAIYSGSTLLTGFEGLTNGSLALFRAPSHSGTTDTNLLDWPDSAAVTGAEAFEGTQAHKLMFQFVDNQPKRWVRITSVYDAAANPPMPTMPVQNPMIDLTQPITMRIKLYGVPPCGAVYADIEPDGDVDMDDFAEFQRCLTIGGGGAYPSECACFDHDFNNAIDENDLTSFSACASGANVPAVAGCGN